MNPVFQSLTATKPKAQNSSNLATARLKHGGDAGIAAASEEFKKEIMKELKPNNATTTITHRYRHPNEQDKNTSIYVGNLDCVVTGDQLQKHL
ncbi:hypothetical protein BDC45DRAFT_604842 [Circinella umbellata]|nr:hypothetical protein BDC45DRAFT_604842 [Circinella umbellata]